MAVVGGGPVGRVAKALNTLFAGSFYSVICECYRGKSIRAPSVGFQRKVFKFM